MKKIDYIINQGIKIGNKKCLSLAAIEIIAHTIECVINSSLYYKGVK